MSNGTLLTTTELAHVLMRLAAKQDVAAAAVPAERRLNRVYLRACDAARRKFPLGEVTDVLNLAPAAGGVVYVLEDTVRAFESALLGVSSGSRVASMRALAENEPGVLGAVKQAMAAGAGTNELCVLEPTLTSSSKEAGGITITQSQILKIWDGSQSGKTVAQLVAESGYNENQVKWVVSKVKSQSPGIMKVLGKFAPPKKAVVTPPPSLTPLAPPTPTVKVPTSGSAWPLDEAAARRLGTRYPKQVNDHYEPWVNNIDSRQIDALKSYTGSEYREINAVLRGNSILGNEQHYRSLIDGINQALAKAPKPPPPELVWRGASNQGARDFVAKLKTGDSIQLKGFTSTSIRPGFAESWGETVFEIKPKSGAYVASLSHHRSEYEFLLPHNTKFRVRGMTKVNIETSSGLRQSTVVQLEEID